MQKNTDIWTKNVALFKKLAVTLHLEKELKTLFKCLNINYGIKIYGYYNVYIYVDKYYGVVIDICKEDIDYISYDETSVDMRIVITNKEFFITKGLLENNRIDNSLQNLLIERKKYESSTEDIINSLKGFFLIYPIIIDSDILGLFIFFKEKELNNQDKTLANIILKILENR